MPNIYIEVQTQTDLQAFKKKSSHVSLLVRDSDDVRCPCPSPRACSHVEESAMVYVELLPLMQTLMHFALLHWQQIS